MDAQDYLGSWHLSIVIDEDPQTGSKTVHFLPFTKANRNEVFSASGDDNARIAAAFTKSETSGSAEPFKGIETLRQYLANNPPKVKAAGSTTSSRPQTNNSAAAGAESASNSNSHHSTAGQSNHSAGNASSGGNNAAAAQRQLSNASRKLAAG